MRSTRAALLGGFLALVLASPAGAQQIVGRSTGLSGSPTTLDFDDAGLPQGAVVTDEFPGVTFSPNLFYSADGSESRASFEQGYLYNHISTTVDPFWIIFGSAVKGAAFQLESNNVVSEFSAYLGATLVSTFSANTNFGFGLGNTPWYGFENILFDRIEVDVAFENEGGFLSRASIDNLQYVTITPEPVSLLLLGTGLAGVGALGRRRRREPPRQA